MRFPLASLSVLGIATGLSAAVATASYVAQTDTRDATHLVALTDDSPHDLPGCDAITVASTRDGLPAAYGSHRLSPGQLTGTYAGDLLVSLSTNNGLFLAVLDRRRGEKWESYYIDDDGNPGDWLAGGAIAISPDDRTVLVARMGGVEKFRTADIQPGVPLGRPLGIATIDDSDRLGFRANGPGDIVFSHDSRSAYIVATNGSVYFLDVPTMAWTRSPVEYEPTTRTRNWFRMRRTFATLSTDGKYLVVNTGSEAPHRLNVIDVSIGDAWLLEQPAQLESWGVAFGHRGPAAGTLAVHGRTSVAVYRWAPMEALKVLATWRVVPAQSFDDLIDWGESLGQRIGALAWFADGTGLVSAKGGRPGPEWELLDYRSQEINLRARMDSCVDLRPPGDILEPFDVFTSHRPLPRSPTPAPSPSATVSQVPTQPTGAVTVMPTSSATPTVPSTPRPPVSPVFLPAVLSQECEPALHAVDFALVFDASSSMLEPQSDGKTKLEIAAEAASGLVDLLGARDRAAVISFNLTAHVLQDLTSDKRRLRAALRDIEAREFTRIDLGVSLGHQILMGGRKDDTAGVMVLLTDGKANPVPVDVAVEAAGAAKRDGVTVVTIGLGPEETLDLDGLIAMSSGSEYFYHAPDPAGLLSIYQSVAAFTDRCP